MNLFGEAPGDLTNERRVYSKLIIPETECAGGCSSATPHTGVVAGGERYVTIAAPSRRLCNDSLVKGGPAVAART